jgi:hypothetical protein
MSINKTIKALFAVKNPSRANGFIHEVKESTSGPTHGPGFDPDPHLKLGPGPNLGPGPKRGAETKSGFGHNQIHILSIPKEILAIIIFVHVCTGSKEKRVQCYKDIELLLRLRTVHTFFSKCIDTHFIMYVRLHSVPRRIINQFISKNRRKQYFNKRSDKMEENLNAKTQISYNRQTFLISRFETSIKESTTCALLRVPLGGNFFRSKNGNIEFRSILRPQLTRHLPRYVFGYFIIDISYKMQPSSQKMKKKRKRNRKAQIHVRITTTPSKPLIKVKPCSQTANFFEKNQPEVLRWIQKEKEYEKPGGWRKAIGQHLATMIIWDLTGGFWA